MNISKERLERALSRFIYDFTENEGHSDEVAKEICDFSNNEYNYIRSLVEFEEDGLTEQFFRPVIQSNRKTNVYDRTYILRKREYRSPDRLIEHALIGDKFVNSICEKIYNSHVPTRITWLGNKSYKLMELPVCNLNGIHPLKIRYYCSKYWNKDTYTTSAVASDFSIIDKIIVNHSKKIYIDGAKYYKNSVVNGVCLNPIPLLTCIGNGLGVGDYNYPTEDSDFHLIGSWAWDDLSIYHEPPAGYRELNITFKSKIY